MKFVINKNKLFTIIGCFYYNRSLYFKFIFFFVYKFIKNILYIFLIICLFVCLLVHFTSVVIFIFIFSIKERSTCPWSYEKEKLFLFSFKYTKKESKTITVCVCFVSVSICLFTIFYYYNVACKYKQFFFISFFYTNVFGYYHTNHTSHDYGHIQCNCIPYRKKIGHIPRVPYTNM